MDNVATPAFGIANQISPFNQGVRPRIAMSPQRVIVTTFSDTNSYMYYAIGTLKGLVVELQDVEKLQNSSQQNHAGYVPAVTISPGNMVVEMHVNNMTKHSLYYSSGQLGGRIGEMSIDWSESTQYDDGLMPALSNVTADNYFLEFHTTNDLDGYIYWHLGQVDASGVTWADGSSQVLTFNGAEVEGSNASVAIHGATVVLAYEYGKKLYYMIGVLDTAANTISWQKQEFYDTGRSPSLVVLADGFIHEFHEGDKEKLWQRAGRLSVVNSVPQITWYDWLGQGRMSYEYDINFVPAVASDGRVAVQVCAAGDEQIAEDPNDNYDLYCSASCIFFRGRWMGGNASSFPDLTIGDIAMAASHDAGMYTGNLAKAARTQNLNFLGQCLAGSRYFDIRPTLSYGTYSCYHGLDHLMIGANIQDALDEIKQFLTAESDGGWGAKELIVLKFSHYGNDIEPTAGNAGFTNLLTMISDTLGAWLCPAPPAGARIADYTLSMLLKDKGCVLVVCDEFNSGYASGGTVVKPNIYAYRDWQSTDPQNGDLTVFDIYSDTIKLDLMMNGTSAASDNGGPDIANLPDGQNTKFAGPGVPGQAHYAGFDGTCYQAGPDGTPVPCDLFLLSWTLTSGTDVWDWSQHANGALVDNIYPMHANGLGKVINMIYVDYVSYSHAADVAYMRNGFAR